MTCIDAFKNLYIEERNGGIYISPCCLISPVSSDKINFHHPFLVKIRNSWKENTFAPECLPCKNAEKNNLTSRRQGSNVWYNNNDSFDTNVEFSRLDYWVGDTCNLACVICGPKYSSKWKQEIKIPLSNIKQNTNRSWRNIDLKNLKFVHFNGGEPMLNKEHLEFLRSIPNKSCTHLNYNTNGTVLPSQELLELWDQFKLVQLDFSIDDIGDRFEYQRYPAKWTSVESNLKWYIDNSPVNCMFAVNTTVSILNQANLGNLNIWLKSNFYINRVADPIDHRQQLAHGIFSVATAKLNQNQIIKFLDGCDSRRNTNWRSTFPELVDFINT